MRVPLWTDLLQAAADLLPSGSSSRVEGTERPLYLLTNRLGKPDVGRIDLHILFIVNSGVPLGIATEGSVDTKVHWEEAQAYPYTELTQQLKTRWSNGNIGEAQNDDEKPVQAVSESESTATPEHYCQEHQT